MQRQQQAPTQQRIPRFKLVRKMGFPDALSCWCGAHLADHTNPQRREELNAFAREHAACPQPEKEKTL